MSPRSPSPLSEGEIASGDEEKAISTSTNKIRNSKVNMSTRLNSGSSFRAAQLDGMDRLATDVSYHFRDDDGPVKYSRERSPYHRDRSRSRSPFRAVRPSSGEKRRHEDDHYNRKGGSDPRRFKVHYESDPSLHDSANRFRRPYADLDRPIQPRGHLSYDDRAARGRELPNNVPHDRDQNRDRSRSPFRHSRTEADFEQRDGDHESIDGRQKYMSRPSNGEDVSEQKRDVTLAVNERESTQQISHEQNNAKIKVSLTQHSISKIEGVTNRRSVHTNDCMLFVTDV